MGTVIANRQSGSPISLPYPFRGALRAQQAVSVDAPLEDVRAALGSVAGALELREVTTGPYSAFHLGNLGKPSDTAQLATDVAALQASVGAVAASQTQVVHDGPHTVVLLASSAVDRIVQLLRATGGNCPPSLVAS